MQIMSGYRTRVIVLSNVAVSGWFVFINKDKRMITLLLSLHNKTAISISVWHIKLQVTLHAYLCANKTQTADLNWDKRKHNSSFPNIPIYKHNTVL